MAYGDALGFLNENTKDLTTEFIPFQYIRDHQLKMQLPQGQWSEITELSLIITKCLIDLKEKSKTIVDYKRITDELNLWEYYRHGEANLLRLRIREGKNYYQNPIYHNDKRGYGFSRIIPILLANKNFEAAKEEVVKQITYLNQHPQVILTAILLARVIFLLLEKGKEGREDLINQLKDFLIGLQRDQLLINEEKEPSKKYILQFEQEKINYLMALDRLKDGKINQITVNPDSQSILLLALDNYWRLEAGLLPDFQNLPKEDQKEILALAYGFWGIVSNAENNRSNEYTEQDFIENMGEYICKVRNYEVGKKPYEAPQREVDLFQLKEGTVIKHPILNVTKVTSKEIGKYFIKVEVETKTGQYKLYKRKTATV